MKAFFILGIVLISQINQVLAQNSKVEKLKFCGVTYSHLDKLKEQLSDQFSFLRIQENDTIVDIGASSGWYEGAFSAGSTFQNLHFILVDIDSACLNQGKLNNMVEHYSKVKGRPILNSFTLVHNTTDSLYLPQNTFRKVWLMNVLHEIPDKKKMIRDIEAILQPGGELILLEFIPVKPGALHGGCHKPLLSLEEWRQEITPEGFILEESIQVQVRKKLPRVNMIRFIKQ